MQLSSRLGVFSVVVAVLLFCTAASFSQTVDNSTLSNKFMIGYQGWHACQGDGNPVGTYIHWSHSSAVPSTSDAVDDIWPDLTEFTAGELFSTGLTLGNSQAAKVYSAYLGQTVNRHFAWMKTNGIDGVMAQRFTKDVFTDANWTALKNQVLVNVKNGSETNGRVFCIEYDISNDATNLAISHLMSDWASVTGTLGVTNSSRYLKHKGKPLVGIWGLGFSNIPSSTAMYTPAQALTIISNFHSAGCTVMGGVPYWWRFLINDAQPDTNWLTVYKSFDVINPWAVGRYQNASQMDSFRSSVVAGDVSWCVSNNVDYLPVIFPGYSAANLNGTGGTSNSAPRLAGSFYWRQAYDNLSSGCKMLFGAMFDEIDEGTAIYKLAPTMSTTPQYTNMFALNVDGTSLPSDWYLQVAGQITKAAHGGPLNTVLPITPTNSITVTSPNGGDFWFAGSTATVTWTSLGTVGNVSIDLSTDGGQSFRSLAYNVSNNGSNTVNVPFWPGTNCLVRVQALSGAPADWSDAAFTIKTNSQDGATHLESMWNIAPGSVSYISTGTSAVERGLAYNALSNELVIVHHGTDGLSVNVIDADTGAFKKTLNTSGITQGGFLLDRVGITGDGVIYAANVQTSVSGSAPFKVYRWANSDPNTLPTVAYSGTAGFPNGERVGDCFALRGAGSNTQILIGSRADKTASLLTTVNGTNFTATLYTSDAATNTFGLCVAFDSTNTFWGKTNGLPLTKVSYNTTNQTATTVQTITTLPNFGTFGIDAANKLLAAIVPGNGPDQLNLYSITNPTSPTLLDSWTFANTNGNGFWVGTVVFAGNRLFALDSDRGLLAFRINAQRVADMRFDLAGFCCGCPTSLCQDQFDHLNFVSTNGHYVEQSSDDHISQIFSNGNSVAFYYNNFDDGAWTNETGAQKAADINTYVTTQYSPTNGRPTWLILNEISSGTWPNNASYRQYVNDTAHALKTTYGYTVIMYSPFPNPANNSSNWTALMADAYIGIENYLSGQEIKNNGFSVSWCQSQYQSSVTSYASVGVPKNRLILGEHFGQTVAGTSYGRAGVSAADWISAINARSQGAINVGFPGFIGFLWGNGDTNVSMTDLLSFEDAYASNNLPGPNPWNNPPVVTKQPSSQTAGAGTNVMLSVTSSGTAPLLFKWYKNGAPLNDGGNVSGTTSDILTLGAIQGPEVGSYSVVISNTFGTMTSTIATLNFSGPIVIIGQPAGQTNAYGVNTIFNINAVGSTPITYRWTKNGSALNNGGNISGATSSNLTVATIHSTDAGTYQCVVTNSFNTVTSSPAPLTVVDPGIVTQPQSQGTIVGSNVVFHVVASGTPTLTYRWQKNAVNLSDGGSISGSGTSNLTVTAVAMADQGTYTVVVSNSNGTITSQQAVLTVADLPPSIATQPQSRTDAAGSLSTFSVVAVGNGLFYQWYKNQIPLVDGGTISGSTAPTLSISNAVPTDAASYTVIITNGFGSITSAVATLTIVYKFPYYDPFNYTAGTVLAGQSNSIGIKWDEVGTGTAGNSIQVSSGNLTNSSLVPPIGNSLRFGGSGKSVRFSFPSGTSQTSGTMYYTYLLKITDLTGLSSSGVFVAGFNNSTGTQSSQPSEVGTRLYLRSASGGYNIGMSKDSSTTTDWVWDSRVFTTSDTVLLAGAYTFNSGSTTNDLAQMWINPNPSTFNTTTPPTPDLSTTNGNDISGIASFVYLQRVTTEPASMTVDELRIGTNWATVTPVPPPSITTQPQNQTVVSGYTTSFSVAASGATPLSYLWNFNGVPISAATNTSYTITNAAPGNAGSYYAVVTNIAGSATSSNATLTVIVSPSISMQPSNQTVVAGSDVTFAVSANGTAPLSYQWRFNSSPIANATGSTYTTTDVDSSDVGSYSVVITNSAGMVTSGDATLTVNVPPSIAPEPASQTALLGANVTFSTGATGTTPLSFQWLKNGSPIANATTTTFSINGVAYSDAATYTVVVTNVAGSDTSTDAVLVVPTAFPQLINIVINGDNTVSSTWAVTANAIYRLDYKNNLTDTSWTTIGNFSATSNSLTITDAPLTNSQRFYQLASDSSTSSPAGVMQIPLLGNSDSCVSVPFTRANAIVTAVSGVSGNVITVSNVPGWTPNQFVYASGTQSNTYYARFTSGSAEGRIYQITSNDTNTVTVSLGTDTLNNVTAGDGIAIEAYWTLNTVFPNGTGVNVSPTLGNRNTEVLIPDFASVGINLSATKIYFFNAGTWKQVGQGTANHNDDILLPNTYFTVRHNVSTNTILAAVGNVITSKVAVVIQSSATLQQDNSLGLMRPAPVSLNNSGLVSSGAFSPSPLPGSRTDELLTFDNSATNRNKSPSSVYYYWNNAWRQVGAGTNDVGDNQVLGAGSAVIIRKGTNAAGNVVWTNAPNY